MIKNVIIILLIAFVPALSGNKIDSLSKLLPDARGSERAAILNCLARENLRIDPQKSLSYASEALKLSIELSDSDLEVKSNKSLGAAYYYLNNYPKSIEKYKSALSILQKNGNKMETSEIIATIGEINVKSGNYRMALENYKNSYELYKGLADDRGMAKALNNMGNMYLGLGDKDKALSSFRKALVLFEKIGNTQGKAKTLNNIGKVYYQMGEFKKPVSRSDRASLKIREEIGVKQGISASLNLKNENEIISADSLEKMRLKKLLRYFDESIELSREGGYREIMLENYEGFSKIYESTGDYRKALENYKLYTEIRDSIYDREINQKMAEMRIKYETDKIEKENELLREKQKIRDLELSKQKTITYSTTALAILFLLVLLVTISRFRLKTRSAKALGEKNVQLERANKMLIESEANLKEINATKDKFFTIMAHDLKAPINSFLAVSAFLVERFDQLERQMVRESIVDISKTAKELNSLLENLLTWSRSQIGAIEIFPEEISVDEIADHNISHLRKSADLKNIRLISEVPEEMKAYADMEVVLTIVRNLVSNAIKFTTEGGKVIISAQEAGDYVEISVEDNGIGIDKEQQEKLFRLDVEFDKDGNRKGGGLGLILCKEFVSKSGGEIRVESEPGKGSRFTFTIPKDANPKL